MRRLRRFCIALAPLALAGCGGIFDPQGPVADGERKILLDSLVVMLALIVPTLLGAAGVMWWFRGDNKRARYEPTFTFSGRLEILIWSVPTLIIVFLGGLIWFGSHELDPFVPLQSRAKPLKLQVVSLDWKWLFVYPEQNIATVNQLIIPAGRPIDLELTSASVMNTFWVPQLAGMIYTMNGMVTQLHLQADRPGMYRGRSGDFSGDGFPAMYFDVRSVSDDDFAKWVADARASGKTLDPATYRALAQPGVIPQPLTYQSVEDNLFQQISTQAIEPGQGPALPPATKQSEK